MTPSLAVQNSLYLGAGNSEPICQIGRRAGNNSAMAPSPKMGNRSGMEFGVSAYFTDRFFGNPSHPVAFAFRRTAFRCGIAHVVELRAKKKVRRINAKRVVAFVTHGHPRRNRSELDNPLKATCDVVHFAGRANGEDAISFIVFAGFPVPAPVALFVLCIESVDRFLCNFHVYILAWGAAQ